MSNEQKLREDEIEALLRFDGAVLVVRAYGNPLLPYEYVAMIDYSLRHNLPSAPVGLTHVPVSLARAAGSRLEAVQAVWQLYQQRRGVPAEAYGAGEIDWHLEEARGRVEAIRSQLTSKEKQHG